MRGADCIITHPRKRVIEGSTNGRLRLAATGTYVLAGRLSDPAWSWTGQASSPPDGVLYHRMPWGAREEPAVSNPQQTSSEDTKSRVVLADDDVLLREGLASLLERGGLDVVGRSGTAEDLLALVRELTPDLAIVDVRMPPNYSTEGLDAASRIREEFPDIAVLVLSAHVEAEQAMDFVASGPGTGYLLKSRVVDIEAFVGSIRRVLEGGSVVDPALVVELVAMRRRHDPLGSLTVREREVLSLMAEGYSNTGIAGRISVSEGTVEKHVRSIMMKLKLPEKEDDHRRVLAVLAFLERR
jgi:DNA-binding NarL/FixJ family response regulator